MTDLTVLRSAVFSPDKVYRYRLERDLLIPESKTAAVCMVNPSTADEHQDDATIRRVMEFCRRMRVGRIIILNAFAFRSTDIKGLRATADPIGPENDAHIERAFREANIHVVAWGPLAKLPRDLRNRWRDVTAIAGRVGCELKCWGVAKDGQPLHPLMLSYDSELRRTPPGRLSITHISLSTPG